MGGESTDFMQPDMFQEPETFQTNFEPVTSTDTDLGLTPDFSAFGDTSTPDTGLTDDFMSSYGNGLMPPNPDEAALNIDQGPSLPTDFYNPESLQSYINQASQPSEAERLLAAHQATMPNEKDFRPGFWRALGGSLLGLAASNFGRNPEKAGQVAGMIFNDPYNTAMSQWTAEGKNVSQLARQVASDEQRELLARKYGLQTEATGAYRASLEDRARRSSESLEEYRDRMAGLREREIEGTNKQREISNQRAADQLTLSKHIHDVNEQNMLEDNTRANERATRESEDAAAKASSLGAINKRLSDYASQKGIDTSDMTALDVAKQLAYQQAKSNKAFEDLLEQDENGNWTLNTPKYGSDRTRILQNHINFLVQKYLKGQF